MFDGKCVPEPLGIALNMLGLCDKSLLNQILYLVLLHVLMEDELITLAGSKLYLAGGKWRQAIFGIDPNCSSQRT